MTLPLGVAVLCLGPGGEAVARKLVAGLPGARLHGFAPRVPVADVSFDDTMDHVASLFAAGVPVVGVCAAGILIRAVAPHLADKFNEAAVVAMAEDGSAAVPLIGGHHGANALARACADLLGGHAAVTTAGDARFGVALDEPPAGWTVANPAAAKAVMAALLAGEPVVLEGKAGWLDGLPFAAQGDHRVIVTERAVEDDARTLVLHPPRLALGVGCERDCEPSELVDLVRATLAGADLAEGAVACVASIDLKADEPAVIAAAAALDVPLVLFDAATLEAQSPRLANPSEVVFAEVGCHGVSEGAALAAAGAASELVVAKTKTKRATCAVALAPADIDARAAGRARGRLVLVGLGPGDAMLRLPEASRAIAAATDLVGYGYYLDLAGSLTAGKRRHDFALGEEEARCRAALDLAGEGRHVALICSGDPGIYAMAALVHEVLDVDPQPAWRGVEVAVVPGVSAFQVASARAGAPFGHDFCTISLSDLLTPREVIMKRVKAAAEGDFAIAFYNPVSKRRRDQLVEARAILLEHRPADTPVMIGRMLGRPEESMAHTTLAELAVDDVDMMSVVLVGASQTRRYRRLGADAVYTPRGYARKRDQA
ncbi:MAG: precorrin-3B C(17)-methyltransferase [Proteobacteria bacterium]|nr:precorrin-3B C(17)-methyltransferase [Pseudomonadota bacterium]